MVKKNIIIDDRQLDNENHNLKQEKVNKLFSKKVISNWGVSLNFSFYWIEYIPSKEEINDLGFDPWLIISVKGIIWDIYKSNCLKFSSNITILFSEIKYILDLINKTDCNLDMSKNDINFYSDEYETIEPWFKIKKSIVHDLNKDLIYSSYLLSFDNEYWGMFGVSNINVDIDNTSIDNQLNNFFKKIDSYINKEYKQYIK